MSEDPRPGTTAAVEQRVTRIESKVDSLETRVARVEVDVDHTRELLSLQFTAVQTGQTALMAKFEGMSSKLTAGAVEAARMMADPSATSAGKQIMERVAAAEGIANAALKAATEGQRRFAFIAGAAAIVVTLLNLIGPIASAIRLTFGTP